jgi:RND family efflux transporter MFP subunit
MIRNAGLIGGGALAIAALLSLGGCARSSAASAPLTAAPAARSVAAAKVERGTVDETLTLAAEFRPFQEIDVHAKVAGYVKEIGVDVGDRVKAGQLLAVLEIPELEDEIRQDEAAERRSQEEVHRADADLQRAESAHEIAHLGATRLAAVLRDRPKLVAQQDIDEAQARDRMAEAQVATAKAAVASSNEQLAVAQATKNHTRTLFGYARITAPFAGVITRRYADTGAMIQAGTASQTQTMPIVRLSENALLRLALQVPESAVSRIHVGAPVDVRVASVGRTFPGKIARFAERVNAETRTMDTEIDVPNPQLELVPGMYADAAIVLDRASDVIVAPVQAVDRDGDRVTVLAVTPGHAVELRDVKLGLESADRVEIRSGLSEGDLVIVGSRAGLKAGTAVTPVVARAAAAQKEASH